MANLSNFKMALLEPSNMKFKLIAEVKDFIPSEIKRESELIERIYAIRDENVEEIYKEVNDNNAKSIIIVIEHALIVRPNKT